MMVEGEKGGIEVVKWEMGNDAINVMNVGR